MTAHMNSQAEGTPYPCRICKKKFEHQEQLRVHLKNTIHTVKVIKVVTCTTVDPATGAKVTETFEEVLKQ